MTPQEKQEYDRLSLKQKKVYDLTKELNPHWDHKRIMVKVGFDENIGTMIDGQGGQNINPKDPSILKDVLEGTKRFLKRYGIDIGKIMDLIDGAIKSLSRIISSGLDFLGDLVDGAIGWLFD
ncbi:MAG: hypothetical protein HDS56_02050 [Barnesiella sp.]|nr:hypothetical protein [Barnesiella sp.]